MVVYLWLLLVPTQLGKHFWLPESYVRGIRVDYLSLILYAVDIIWMVWMGIEMRKQSEFRIQKKNWWQIGVLAVVIIGNLIGAEAVWVAVYRWLRIGQWWLTWRIIAQNKPKYKEMVRQVLPYWIVGESFLGLAQVLNNGSLNGLIWWLGERRFSYGALGVAQLRWWDEAVVRAYGTFSHPNSMAGFLLVAWNLWRILRKNSHKEVGYWVVWWSGILGMIVSGSRTVWVVGLAVFLMEKMRGMRRGGPEFRRKIIGWGLVIVGLGALLGGIRGGRVVGGWDSDSWVKREKLAMASVEMIKRFPFWGVGAGNFVVRLPGFWKGGFYWMQPVHNIFLLAASEIGWLGLGLIIALAAKKGKKMILGMKRYWGWGLIIGLTGMVDHYWLTLPQNSWLLAIVLGLI